MKRKIIKISLILLCVFILFMVSILIKVELGKIDINESEVSELQTNIKNVPDDQNSAILLKEFSKPKLTNAEYDLLEKIINGKTFNQQAWELFYNKYSNVYEKINKILDRKNYQSEAIGFDRIPNEAKNMKLLTFNQMELSRIKLYTDEVEKVNALLKLLHLGFKIKINNSSLVEAVHSTDIINKTYHELIHIAQRTYNSKILYKICNTPIDFNAIKVSKNETAIQLQLYCDYLSNESKQTILNTFEINEGWMSYSYFHDLILHRNRTKKLLMDFFEEFSNLLEIIPSAKEFLVIHDRYTRNLVNEVKKGKKSNVAGSMVLLQFSWFFHYSIPENSIVENRLNHLKILSSKRLFELKYNTKLNNISQLVPEYLPHIPYDYYLGKTVSYNTETNEINIYIKEHY